MLERAQAHQTPQPDTFDYFHVSAGLRGSARDSCSGFSAGPGSHIWLRQEPWRHGGWRKESGGFAKGRLDVEMISISSTLLLPALIANEVDAIQISAAPLINAALRGFDGVFSR
jgi:hypothetical protein